jgi:hypothetical protein
LTSNVVSMVMALLYVTPLVSGRADVDLATWSTPAMGLEVWGATAGDIVGSTVAGAGDINHDGYNDVIVGAYLADPLGRVDAGIVYLVFGGPGRLTGTLDC